MELFSSDEVVVNIHLKAQSSDLSKYSQRYGNVTLSIELSQLARVELNSVAPSNANQNKRKRMNSPTRSAFSPFGLTAKL